jgi:hypothetical protein
MSNGVGFWQLVMADIQRGASRRLESLAAHNQRVAEEYPDVILFYAQRAHQEKVTGQVVAAMPKTKRRYEWRTVNGLLVRVEENRIGHMSNAKEAWAAYNASKAVPVAA